MVAEGTLVPNSYSHEMVVFRCTIGCWLVILGPSGYQLLLTMGADLCDKGCGRQLCSVG